MPSPIATVSVVAAVSAGYGLANRPTRECRR
jgi:hypothetical protein